MNRFSLIMATLGRVKEVSEFIESLMLQTYRNFELIIVDQNDHDLVKKIYYKYNKQIEIKYIHSDKKGISVNRNLGIQISTGNILAFPDDDCTYDVKTLERVNEFFINNKYDIYSCKVIDYNSKIPFGKSFSYDDIISYKNIMNNCVSISVFIKFKQRSDIRFDECLGVGAIFGSGEESDLIFSLLHKGYKGRYFSQEYIYHPARVHNEIKYESNKRDSLGLGAIMKKEIIYRRNISMSTFFISRLIRPFVGSIIQVKKRKLHLQSIKYRIIGFIKYR